MVTDPALDMDGLGGNSNLKAGLFKSKCSGFAILGPVVVAILTCLWMTTRGLGLVRRIGLVATHSHSRGETRRVKMGSPCRMLRTLCTWTRRHFGDGHEFTGDGHAFTGDRLLWINNFELTFSK
jgi:hypothetical protein